MLFLLALHEICSPLLVNQDNRKTNRGSNSLAINPHTYIKVGLMNQIPAKEESNPYKEIKRYKEKKVGLINQAPTTGSNQYKLIEP